MIVSEPTPQFVSVGKTNYSTTSKLYNSHDLYNKHQPYYGAISSDFSPPMGYVEEKSPTLYSVVND